MRVVTPREQLDTRRPHEAISFTHGGFRYIAGVGRFDDGRLAEIFLAVSKPGAEIESWARDVAIVASLALQHGVAAETIRKALTRDEQGEAAGPVGALLDLLAKPSGEPGGRETRTT